MCICIYCEIWMSVSVALPLPFSHIQIKSNIRMHVKFAREVLPFEIITRNGRRFLFEIWHRSICRGVWMSEREREMEIDKYRARENKREPGTEKVWDAVLVFQNVSMLWKSKQATGANGQAHTQKTGVRKWSCRVDSSADVEIPSSLPTLSRLF